ncbi:Brix-domain-containing protein [Polychaeton citri CBS 116435]|uniref:Brix-domain-containing protein n=1 Tax=Polychaeton citri CBS 116435 TaxID=1314669 RepID=A0A9P4Q2J6_9PEZI|nr:Brix-domain-containing protein [Polychaeton citri CBS 116435]
MSIYKAVSKTKTNGEERGEDRDVRKSAFRSRVLLVTSRGVTYRHRHLMNDLYALLPHSRKDAKLDSKKNPGNTINELCELYNCNMTMYFEARKSQDLYMWLARAPNGPTCKFHCLNIHTMEELNFTGNCLKGSRPILSFDGNFDRMAHAKLIKEVLTHTFGVPQASRKIKPFVDHVMGFTLADNKIWVRCYQITETEAGKSGPALEDDDDVGKVAKGDTSIQLVEIGPRFVLTPIVILEGSFGGPVIYENKEFVSPNQIRSDLRRARSGKYNKRAESIVEKKARHRDLGLRTGEGVREVDELDDRVLFA